MEFKNLLALGLLLIILISAGCHQGQTNESDSDKQKEINKNIDSNLAEQKEKIVLLALSKGYNIDTLYSLFKDYQTLTYDSETISDKINYKQTIQTLSVKYNISEAKVAALIFSYYYEMLSNEEIAEREFEKMRIENQEPPEDPR